MCGRKKKRERERNQIFRLPRRLSPRRLFSFGEGQKRVRVLVRHVESDYLTRALAHVWLVKELHLLSPLFLRRFGLPLRLFRGSSSRLCLALSDIGHSNSLPSLSLSLCHPPFASSSVSATLSRPPPRSPSLLYSRRSPLLRVVLSFPSATNASVAGCRNVDSRFAIHQSLLCSLVRWFERCVLVPRLSRFVRYLSSRHRLECVELSLVLSGGVSPVASWPNFPLSRDPCEGQRLDAISREGHSTIGRVLLRWRRKEHFGEFWGWGDDLRLWSNRDSLSLIWFKLIIKYRYRMFLS